MIKRVLIYPCFLFPYLSLLPGVAYALHIPAAIVPHAYYGTDGGWIGLGMMAVAAITLG